MRTRAQGGHGPEVLELGRRQLVNSNPEESRVERRLRSRGRPLHISEIDGRLVGRIPGVFAPLLEEIGVTARLFEDSEEGFLSDSHSLIHYRLLDRASGRLLIQPSDGRKVEQALRVGLRLSGEGSQLR